jgi:transcriptional regulator with XRE-family HTH domain
MDIGQRLNKALKDNDISVARAAARIGRDPGTILLIVKGRIKTPHDGTVAKIERFLAELKATRSKSERILEKLREA